MGKNRAIQKRFLSRFFSFEEENRANLLLFSTFGAV
jgi:hypothetical protein